MHMDMQKNSTATVICECCVRDCYHNLYIGMGVVEMFCPYIGYTVQWVRVCVYGPNGS